VLYAQVLAEKGFDIVFQGTSQIPDELVASAGLSLSPITDGESLINTSTSIVTTTNESESTEDLYPPGETTPQQTDQICSSSPPPPTSEFLPQDTQQPTLQEEELDRPPSPLNISISLAPPQVPPTLPPPKIMEGHRIPTLSSSVPRIPKQSSLSLPSHNILPEASDLLTCDLEGNNVNLFSSSNNSPLFSPSPSSGGTRIPQVISSSPLKSPRRPVTLKAVPTFVEIPLVETTQLPPPRSTSSSIQLDDGRGIEEGNRLEVRVTKRPHPD